MKRLTLSIQEPWIWAIMHAGKNVENRTWRVASTVELPVRIVIHASKTWDHEGSYFLLQDPEARAIIDSLPVGPPMNHTRNLGALVGEVTITGCLAYAGPELVANPWAFGPWCWMLESPVEWAEPIAWRGMPGLFEVDL